MTIYAWSMYFRKIRSAGILVCKIHPKKENQNWLTSFFGNPRHISIHCCRSQKAPLIGRVDPFQLTDYFIIDIAKETVVYVCYNRCFTWKRRKCSKKYIYFSEFELLDKGGSFLFFYFFCSFQTLSRWPIIYHPVNINILSISFHPKAIH